MRLQVRHLTRYDYSQPVSQSVNRLCLLPRSDAHQRCLSTRLEVAPEPTAIHFGSDHYGNSIARFGLHVPHRRCSVTVTSLVDTVEPTPSLPASLDVAENLARLQGRGGADALMAHDCLLPSPYVPADPAVDALLAELPLEGLPVLELAESLMHHIRETFEYDPKFSTLVTPIGDVLDARRGVCQDFAHLAIAALRRARVPARYVSGYLETLPPPGQQKLRGADASHAWFAAYDAERGWHDFDPTNGKRPDGQYVVTAQGRDYGDVTPLKGIVYGGGTHRLRVEVDVDREAAGDGAGRGSVERGALGVVRPAQAPPDAARPNAARPNAARPDAARPDDPRSDRPR